ncbi:MAG: virulence factor [Caldilineaceae bacterium]
MAEYQITYWRQIPSMVTAREGRRNTFKVELPQRFQAAIDELAMRAGLIGTDEYLEEWRREPWQPRDGTPEEVAQGVAKELVQEFTPTKIGEILREALL